MTAASRRAAPSSKTTLPSENVTDPKRRPEGGAEGQAYAEIKTYHSHMSMCVNRDDLRRLAPGKWLSSHIINYVIWTIANAYFETRLMKPTEICFLPTLVWADYKSHRLYRPRTTLHPFLSPFVVIPMNVEDSHWIVVIVAYFKSNLIISDEDEDPQRPAGIYVLDPLPTATRDKEFEKDVVKFLDTVGAAQAGFQHHLLGDVPIHWPSKIPKQTNKVDCGLFCLHYIVCFAKSAHEFVATFRGPEGDGAFFEDEEFLGDDGRSEIQALLQISAEHMARKQLWETITARSGDRGASGSRPNLPRHT